MASRRVRSKTCHHPPSRRPGLRSSSSCRHEQVPPANCKDEGLQPTCDVELPHHIMLEVLSFLDTRAIVRGRRVSRAFRTDAPALIDVLEFKKGQKFPSATRMKVFSRVNEVRVDGHNSLVHAAAAGLRGCPSSLRRLTISREPSVAHQAPLTKHATKNLCALPLRELEMRRIALAFPEDLRMPAWDTLEKLVIRDAGVGDVSLANLVASIPAGRPLPMRHLDISRNIFGHEEVMQPLAKALWSFPHMDKLELTADRISSDGAKLVLRALLDGACPRLRSVDLSLNFLHDGVLEYLADGLGRAGHGLQNLGKLGIGGRFSPDYGVTCFESIARALAAGGLPKLDFLHLQGDVGPPQVGPLLRKFKLGACPNLAVVKVERSSRFHPAEDPESTEDAVSSMLELVTSSCAPRLREVHVLGMNLGKGLEWAEEERTAFYRARNESSFHRLALAGARRGVMIFV